MVRNTVEEYISLTVEGGLLPSNTNPAFPCDRLINDPHHGHTIVQKSNQRPKRRLP